MKKCIFIFFIVLFSIFHSFGLRVDEDEIKSAVEAIEFINYSGPYRYQDTALGIKGIGTRLSNFENDNEPFRYLMKYSIIHAVDDTTGDKFDADIFSIDARARVDHIRNVRLMIGAYLEARYNYSPEDALTLATFVTYYNAVNRGDLEYFGTKYKDVVMQNINANNAGMSTKYFEWPGNTRIIIPLTEDAAEKTINSLDTTELTDTKVIEELKKQDDKGITEREKITDIKEKQIEEKQKEIVEDKKNIEEEKKVIEQKEAEIKKEKEAVAKIEDKEVKAKKEAEIKVEEKKVETKKEEVAKKEKEVKKKEEQIVKKQETVKKEKQDIAKDKKEVAIKKEPEKFVKELQKKSEELDKKEEELAKKEEQIKNKGEDEKIFQDKFYYLKVKEYMVDGHYTNEMYAIDAASRKILIKSPLRNICGNRYDIFKEGVVVISFKSDHASDHNLTLLDLNTLEPVVTGEDNIFWRSFVIVKDNFIYAIIKDNEDYYLGKYNTKMERVAKSIEKIDNSTFITFYKDFIYINSDKKDILVLNKDDFKLVDKIAPK